MRLHNLKPAPGSRPPKRIVGRGEGSTLGQTAGRGQKGQMSRAGETIMNGFEGGQTPLLRRIPKRGFNHASKIYHQGVNIDTLERVFEGGTSINGQALFEKGLIAKKDTPFKILGRGKLTKAFHVSSPRISKSALKAINAAGGDVNQR